MTGTFSRSEPVEAAEVWVALLVGRGLPWPLARSLAPRVEAVETPCLGGMAVLLKALRVSAVALFG